MKPSEQISVWKRTSRGTLVEYICFRELDTGRYWVWGSHHVQPEDLESVTTLAEVRAEQAHWLLETLARLGSGHEGGERRETFETLDEAIEHLGG